MDGGVSGATSITVRVPLAIRRQPVRTTVVTPAGEVVGATCRPLVTMSGLGGPTLFPNAGKLRRLTQKQVKLDRPEQ